jgi:hypothetical protein
MTDTTIAERIAAQVPGFELPDTPRRFVICEYDDADDSLRLVLWGIQTADRAVGFFAKDRSVWHDTTAEGIEETLSRIMDLELIWLDAHPTAPGETGSGVVGEESQQPLS